MSYRVEVELENCILYLGDCLEVMKLLPDKSVDAVITDPPYGTTELKYDKLKIDWQVLWYELNRVLKQTGVMVIFSAQPFTTDLISSNRKQFRYELIWCKSQGTNWLDANMRPLSAHENILIFSKIFRGRGKGNHKVTTYNPQFTNGKPYHKDDAGRIPAAHYGKSNAGHRVNNGYRYPLTWQQFSNKKVDVVHIHPSQKPFDLITWLINTYSNPDDTIFDPFMGSGTTGMACMQTGRNFIGCEIDPDYFKIAEKRIHDAQQQMKLEGI